MASNHTIVHATGVLTCTANFADTETVTVGGKAYALQATLTNVDGNVKIGADLAASLQNLFDAFNLTGTSGTQYAASMTANTRVKATAVTATKLTVTALTAGEVANLVASTDTAVNASWGGVTLGGGEGNSGQGNVDAFVKGVLALNQINAEVQFELKKLTVDKD